MLGELIQASNQQDDEEVIDEDAASLQEYFKSLSDNLRQEQSLNEKKVAALYQDYNQFMNFMTEVKTTGSKWDADHIKSQCKSVFNQEFKHPILKQVCGDQSNIEAPWSREN